MPPCLVPLKLIRSPQAQGSRALLRLWSQLCLETPGQQKEWERTEAATWKWRRADRTASASTGLPTVTQVHALGGTCPPQGLGAQSPAAAIHWAKNLCTNVT